VRLVSPRFEKKKDKEYKHAEQKRNKKLMFPGSRNLVIEVVSKEHGTYQDNVTKQIQSWAIIKHEQRPLAPSECTGIRTILERGGIEVAAPAEVGTLVLKRWDQVTLAVEYLKSSAWQVMDHPPDHVCLRIHDFVQRSADLYHDVTDTDLETGLGSDVWSHLRPFQRESVRLAVHQKHLMIADEMGSGKTLQGLACAWFHRDKGRCIVVCPSSLRHNWKSEALRWLPLDEKRIAVMRHGQDVKKLERTSESVRPWIIMVSYALVAKPEHAQVFRLLGFHTLILDESHYIKGYASKRALATVRLSRSAKVRIMLTGTPFNYPSELFHQIGVMDHTLFRRFFSDRECQTPVSPHDQSFANRYGKPECMFMRGRSHWSFKGFRHSEELHALLNTMMIRRRKRDILTQLPEKHRTRISLNPLPPRQEKEIKNLLDHAQQQTGGGSSFKYTECFRLTCKYKMPRVSEFLEDTMIPYLCQPDSDPGSDRRALVFCHHTQMREMLEACFGKHKISFFSIHQGVSIQERQVLQDQFQTTDRYQVAILSIKAAGTGLTLTRANMVVFTEILFGPDDMLQAEDRAHRISQTRDVEVIYLLQPNTTDDINFGLVCKKERESSYILGGTSAHLTSQYHRVTPGEKRSLDAICVQTRTKRSRSPSKAPQIRIVRSRKLPL